MSAADLVMVEWMDSRRPDASWKHLAEAEWKPVRCMSVGFLVADDKDKKVLAPNMGDIDDASGMQLSGEITIPTCCVVGMVRLSEVISSSSARTGRAPKRRSSSRA